jgi:plastocyanin
VRPLALALAAVGGLVLALPSVAAGPPSAVNVEFSDYRPNQLDVLPSETVNWTNVSTRTHTVTSDTGLFDSGNLAGGARFSLRFDTVGTYLYHCTIHPSIVGEVDVRRVTLGAVPTAAIPAGAKVELDGRTADPSTQVVVQRRVTGIAFRQVTSVTPAADGTWKAIVPADATADYRAASGADVSETRRLLVENRRVLVRATGEGVEVTVAPSAPYSRFLVEVYLRERFGWWPIASGRVNYVSAADVKLHRPARVRIVLVDKDGWTPLVTSKALVLR